jgi:hypothetical protein
MAEPDSASALTLAICEAAGLHRCPHAPADGPVMMCGCRPGRCADLVAKNRLREEVDHA